MRALSDYGNVVFVKEIMNISQDAYDITLFLKDELDMYHALKKKSINCPSRTCQIIHCY